MIVFIIIAILGFILGIIATNIFLWFVSYFLSNFFALFSDRNKKLTQGLSQTTILLAATVFLFIYSYKGCTYVNRFGGSNDNMPVIGGWFLLLTGLISGFMTFVAFGLSFDDLEEQKSSNDGETDKSVKQIAREKFSGQYKETRVDNYLPKEASENFVRSLNKKELLRIRSLKSEKELDNSFSQNSLESTVQKVEKKLTKKEYRQKAIDQERDKRKAIEEAFIKSPEYIFIQKAAENKINGSDVNYSILKSEIGNKWHFSTNQLSKFLFSELENAKTRIEEEGKFYNNQGYKYIKQFAKKYGEKGKAEDFNQLQTLLENWQYDFSIEELKSLVAEESKKQKIENLKSRILKDNPHNRGAILKSYLNFYRSGDETNLKILVSLLEERYSASENILELKNELQKIEKRIEIEKFEKRLLKEDEQIQLGEIDNFNGYEFEDFLKTLFSKMGYQVEQTKLSGDQGADLVVLKFGEKSVIQAKRFGGKVGNKAVQEILAAMSLYQAHKGMVITNNYFTPAAVELANANNIELIDRDALEELINKHW